MSSYWRLSQPYDDIEIVALGADAPDNAEPIDAMFAAAAIARWIEAHGPTDLSEREGRPLGYAHITSLRDALLGGVLRAYRRRPIEQTHPPREQEEIDDEPIVVDKDDASWIEIELVDMEDNPVGGERYILTLADGSEIAGTTSAAGFVRIPVAEAGQGQLTFPDLDKEAWEDA